ncbi:uncharacterized protein DUF3800 [Kribbella orskensis]|uniref:Uncharacterized protein DUF3800 n=1 Tax=Kribbella orskensis TaxID=2512216 RepID=A0ABY2B947_9ACTN|nr:MULTISPECIES: DUF3800 domain-containing protein [Kribbella]TCN31722.1 uncharacterized protein DUF3800 [Kribbella sp. VKM Ac-2500]TCO12272.1 uncharacterized protein DUF3800 [Kribbella orskensis]
MHSRPLEIACDESGFTGTNLLDPTSPVITHAGVHLDRPAAAEYVALVRARFRHTSTEYKATQMLRQRPVLEWLLGSLRGVGHVHLTDKPFFITCRIVDFLLGEPTYAAGTSLATELRPAAVTLYRDGPAVFGQLRWRAFLATFVKVMRTKRRQVINAAAVDEFYATLGDLRSTLPKRQESDSLQGILDHLSKSRPQLEEVLTLLLDDRSSVPPALEPLLPALLETALHWSTALDWSGGGRSVAIVHDEQSALTRHRVAQVQAILAEVSSGPPPLLSVTMTDSRTDPRVQLADLLAGAARHIAVAELHSRSDPALTELLRPYLSHNSLWPDAPSWQRPTGAPEIRSVTSR